jgi:hypothetical protein
MGIGDQSGTFDSFSVGLPCGQVNRTCGSHGRIVLKVGSKLLRCGSHSVQLSPSTPYKLFHFARPTLCYHPFSRCQASSEDYSKPSDRRYQASLRNLPDNDPHGKSVTLAKMFKGSALPTAPCSYGIPAPHLEEFSAILEAWGFRYCTCWVWAKMKLNFSHYGSIEHELIIVGGKGRSVPTCDPRTVQRVSSVQRTVAGWQILGVVLSRQGAEKGLDLSGG